MILLEHIIPQLSGIAGLALICAGRPQGTTPSDRMYEEFDCILGIILGCEVRSGALMSLGRIISQAAVLPGRKRVSLLMAVLKGSPAL